MPFLPPNQQRQSTEGVENIIVENTGHTNITIDTMQSVTVTCFLLACNIFFMCSRKGQITFLKTLKSIEEYIVIFGVC